MCDTLKKEPNTLDRLSLALVRPVVYLYLSRRTRLGFEASCDVDLPSLRAPCRLLGNFLFVILPMCEYEYRRLIV